MSLHNAHAGETCVIIGNGPSLNDIPNEFLQQYPTFGTNRIYLREGFTPTYYVSVNPLVIEQSLAEINSLSCRAKFVSYPFANQVPGCYPLVSAPISLFSKTPDRYVYEGYTVTYVCLQLAYWMGFTRVLLVGVDHAYAHSGQPNEELVAEGADVNHFHPGYFSNGAKWNAPDLLKSEIAYRVAREVFEGANREVLNLTTQTHLNIFPKEDWRLFIGSRNQPCIPEVVRKDGVEKVSAIVSAYYAEPFLRGRLDNLLSQTLIPEIVAVCHEGSPEQTILSEYTHPNVRQVLFPEDARIPNVYEAWNAGIVAAQGEYLTSANSDDRHNEDALEKAVKVLDRNPKVDAVYFDLAAVKEVDGLPFTFFTWGEGGIEQLLQGCFLGPMPVWRKSLHEKYGLFNPAFRIAGDYEFWLRIAYQKARFLHIPEVLGFYTDRKDSVEHREDVRALWETARARALYRA